MSGIQACAWKPSPLSSPAVPCFEDCRFPSFRTTLRNGTSPTSRRLDDAHARHPPARARPEQRDRGRDPARRPTPCSSDPAFQVTGRDGVVVYKVSGTYVENLTVCNFLTDPVTGEHGNQIWWNGGDGSGQIGMHTYWGNYLTASSGYSNSAAHPRGEYGIFVSNAHGPGSINYSYASNMGDAAFYVGACPNCNAVLDHDHAQYSALAYSGTNSGGNLLIENSEFDHNKTGLDSNSQNNDDLPSPQIGLCPAGSSPAVHGAVGCTIFMNNYLHDNNNADVPGSGAGLAGAAPSGTGLAPRGTPGLTPQHNPHGRHGRP